MTLSDLSIERPVLTWMMMVALGVFGVLGYSRLGVDQFPEMEFPMVTVNATLEGATPEGIEEDVTDPLEERFTTISGIRTSVSRIASCCCQRISMYASGRTRAPNAWGSLGSSR